MVRRVKEERGAKQRWVEGVSPFPISRAISRSNDIGMEFYKLRVVSCLTKPDPLPPRLFTPLDTGRNLDERNSGSVWKK